MKMIKMLGNNKFEIALFESDSGQYVIVVEQDEKKSLAGPFADYNNASFAYDEMLQELQGN